MAAFESQEQWFFSDLLKAFRRRKKLTQQQLAARLEVTRETVSLWERGEYKPETDRILYQIVDVLALSDQEQAQLFEAYTVTALKISFHHPPSKRNPYFTGRGAQLKYLHTLLMAGKQVALTQAISGLGGIGKTQLALEYAYRYQRSYHDIFWASADTEEALMASYVRFAGVLQLPEVKEADQTKVKAAIFRWFQQHTNWLLVVDNIEDLHLLSSFVPEHRQGAVLLTTRRQVTEPVAQALELEVLPEEEAILFLLKRTKVLALDASLEDASGDEMETARTVSRLLGHLPLALDQAGAYILETTCGFAEYATVFQTHQGQLLQRRIGEHIPTDHPDSVTTTFGLNFEQVQLRSDAAADLLRLLAYLAPDAMAEEVLTEGAVFLGPLLSPVAADVFLLNQAIEVLCAYSLVRRDPGEKMLSMHRLVQAVLKDGMDEQTQSIWRQRVIAALDTTFPQVDFGTWERCARLLPHVLLLMTWIEKEPMPSLEAAHLLSQTGVYLRERGLYSDAETLLTPALAIREQKLGGMHPETAESLYNLGVVSWHLGKYELAESLYQRAFSIHEQQAGERHPEAAQSLNNLAILYNEQGKFAEAQRCFLRALHIWELSLGPDHPQVAHPLNGLANMYLEQGKYAEAEPLYQRAISIREKQLGPDHPNVAPP